MSSLPQREERRARAEVVRLPVRRGPVRAALVALRPRQWSKNLLLFAGILFAAELGDATRWAAAVTVFAAYCLASSAAYLANDVRDAESDRLHPLKRERPVARGELSPRAAAVLAVALAAVGLALSFALGPVTGLLLALFLALQAAYTVSLRNVVLLDVMAIAALFVVRAAAGAEAVDVRISPWLLLCTALLALFLALAKRRGELVLAEQAATPGRAVLSGYSLPFVDQLLTVVTAATIVAYSLYTFGSVHSAALMLTIPFVVFGLFRYLLLVHRDDLGEEPEQILLSDRPILAAVALWIVMSALILTLA
ncbi:MAG TPA: decaprenyl-phosphate phosphoribosyltransferase [Gaiellaceae bacterium]|nr:decaprenyl-phosphate phosphoribosyltransferase [Gaiellaceae bacterium]